MKNELGPTEAAPQSQLKLSRGGHVAAEALFCEEAHDGGGRERLRCEKDLEVGLPGGLEGGDEGTRARPQVLLGDDVGGRAVLRGQLDQVTAADLEVAVLVDAAAERVDVRERLRAGHRRAIIAVAAGARRCRARARRPDGARFGVCDDFPMAGRRGGSGREGSQRTPVLAPPDAAR